MSELNCIWYQISGSLMNTAVIGGASRHFVVVSYEIQIFSIGMRERDRAPIVS